ncbi:MAG: hypothetical protein JSU94_18015 [Phycisphaerales bacterium]|nr:MAG: hypothetical protein JSU94_18015 [Phycisphaerales bacterium]
MVVKGVFRAIRFAVLGCLMAASAYGGSGAVRVTLPREPRREEVFHVGACTHFSQGKGVLEMNLQSIRGAGIKAIRDEVSWGGVERTKGKLEMPRRYDEYVRRAAAVGIDVMLILGYSNRFYDKGDRPRSPEAIEGFCGYAEFVVRHFGKDVRLYEIWNEWDIGIGLPEPYRKGGSAEDYVKLLKKVYPRIKAVDPGVTVIAGACTSGGVNRGWLEKTLQLGALDFCDAVSIHSYNYSAKFPERGPEACSAWMSKVQAMLRKYNEGKEVPFYVTEMGWPTHTGRSGTEAELSASYLARLYLLARTSGSFRGIWWYDFQDDGWDRKYNENNFGLVRPDLTAKPAYYVMADISGLVAGGRYAGALETKDENLRALKFEHRGRDFWGIWSSDDKDRQVILRTERSDGYVTIQKLGRRAYRSTWGYRDWAGGSGEFVRDRLSMVVGPRPVLISGDLSGVSVAETILRSGDSGADKN